MRTISKQPMPEIRLPMRRIFTGMLLYVVILSESWAGERSIPEAKASVKIG
jgi:hypothetical protein